MGVEQRLRGGQAALQPGGRGRRDRDRIEVELGLELAGPLLDEMGRAQDREAVGLAAVDQLAQDEPGLDRLADADVVGDQQPHDRKAQRHQQRHELIGAGLEAQPRRRAERPGAAPQRKAQRLGQAAGRRPGSRFRPTSGSANRAGRTGSRSSAGWMSCTSASAPDSGRRQSVSSSGEGSATHSRPRA